MGGRYPWLTALIATIVLGTGGCAGEAPPAPAPAPPPAEPSGRSFLYVQSASTGSLSGAKRGEQTLTLEEVSPHTVYFSDRPRRLAGHVTVDSFVRNWPAIFADDLPNAAIAELRRNERPGGQVVELVARPRYDAREQRLTYRVRFLQGKVVGRARLEEPSLFIDGGCNPLDSRGC